MGIKKVRRNDLIILAGGFGTRLKSVSNGIPKALLPISDSVYLDLLLDRVFNFELDRVYLSLHYRPDLFQKYTNKSIHKKNLSSVVEPEPLGTGGAIYYVIKNSNVSSPFFVINGDSLSDIDLNHMVEEFEKYQYKAMVGISKVDNTKRYGTVSAQNGNVISFNEKGISGCGWINNGHYILTKEVFNEFTGSFSLEKDLFPKLAQNCELGAYKVPNDNFMDMGVPEDYANLCKIMLEESN